MFVKRDEAKEAVFCIDEPELHVATALQGPLIASILELLREPSQLWVATHSIGIVREAYSMLRERPGEVVFLDFSGRDFDGPVTMKPSTPNRAFWENMYEVALADLSSLVAPQRVVICEGSKAKHVKAFDARCYNRLFADEFSETLFISQGGSGEVIQSEHLVAILTAVASGIDVGKLIDRDDMTDEERSKTIAQGIRVLRRREFEEYLYDQEVLRTFLRTEGCEASTVVNAVLEKEGSRSSPGRLDRRTSRMYRDNCSRRFAALQDCRILGTPGSSSRCSSWCQRSARLTWCTRNFGKTCSVRAALVAVDSRSHAKMALQHQSRSDPSLTAAAYHSHACSTTLRTKARASVRMLPNSARDIEAPPGAVTCSPSTSRPMMPRARILSC